MEPARAPAQRPSGMAAGAEKKRSSWEAFWDYEYLSPSHVQGFDTYKYSSVDTSPVALWVSHPLWELVVKLYPRWLAPNVLTLSGGVLVMLYYAVVSWLDPELLASADSRPEHPPLPAFLWLLFGVANLSAHILDGTDGKQARRTGASGPTGELFDHGIDSWLTLPFVLTLFSIFSCSSADFSIPPFRLVLILMSVQLVFVVSHWEKYNTGVLFLPWGYDIGQYGLSIMYVLTWWGGVGMWKFRMWGWLSPAELAEGIFYGACFAFTIPVSLVNIRRAAVAGTLKQRSVWEGLRPLVAVTGLFGLGIVWCLVSRDAAGLGVAERHFRLFTWSQGVVFSNIACRLIVAQMTCTRCELGNKLLWVLGLGMAWSEAGRALWGWGAGWETLVLWALALATTAAHVHYAVAVVRQMTRHFRIHAFSLAYLQRPKDN